MDMSALLSAPQMLPTDDLAGARIKVCILGGGNFGTAMGVVAARKGHEVIVFCREEDQVKSINENRRNNKTLSEYELPENFKATSDLAKALQGCGLILACLPAQIAPDFFRKNRDVIPEDVVICNTAKGLYMETKELLDKPILRALGRDQPYAVLSGPSFAKELMDQQPTAVVVASQHLYRAVAIQRQLSTSFFRVYTSQDVVGVQLGGALKNPLAIGAGFIHGSGFGINTLSSYVTRSCSELQKLCVAMGGRPETVNGLSGIGDLMLTCFGAELSRNCKCGQRLAKGEKLEEVLKDYTVEGVPTAEVAIYLADMCGLDLPIFRAVHYALKGAISFKDIPSLLMNRPLRGELD